MSSNIKIDNSNITWQYIPTTTTNTATYTISASTSKWPSGMGQITLGTPIKFIDGENSWTSYYNPSPYKCSKKAREIQEYKGDKK